MTSISSLIRRSPTILRTIARVRPAQGVAQLRYMLFGNPPPARRQGAPPTLGVARVQTDFLPPPPHVRGGPQEIELLSTRFSVALPVDWESAQHGPLFAYHLHQHEFLRLEGFDPAAREALVRDWIDRHPRGIGWDPHPISLRLLCWGKLLVTPAAIAGEPAFREAMLGSMGDQAETLARSLEVRLQANHLLSNLLSVVWAGILLDCPEAIRWRSLSDRLLGELDAQVLPDGGHEERSPMYHALLLENVLDLLNLCRGAGERVPRGLSEGLAVTAVRMLAALDVWTHPDGHIALFADSGRDIAAEPASLRDYADRLGIRVAKDEAPRATLLPQTGYLKLSTSRHCLIASVGGPSPAHQPGHAHCDALSFELSVDGRRVLSDTGNYEYRPGPRRERARSTASHATIMIDGEEQAEIWSAHRVGGRPEVRVTAWDGEGRAEATCRGWRRGAPVHRRGYRVDEAGVEIEDRIEGDACELVSRWPLAAGWRVELSRESARVRLAEGDGPRLRVDLPQALEWSVEQGACYPTFGEEHERAVLVGRGRGPLETTLRVSIERPA